MTPRGAHPASRCGRSCPRWRLPANSSPSPQPVELDYEIAGCLGEVDGGPALRFAQVEGAMPAAHAMPVVGNLLNSLPRFAAALAARMRPRAGHTDCRDRKPAAASRRRRRRRASSRSSPSLSLADELPIPRFFEKEAGPYITAGAIVARDRVSGHTNLSIARLMPLGGNRGLCRHRAQSPPRGAGAGGAGARREARHRGLRSAITRRC